MREQGFWIENERRLENQPWYLETSLVLGLHTRVLRALFTAIELLKIQNFSSQTTRLSSASYRLALYFVMPVKQANRAGETGPSVPRCHQVYSATVRYLWTWRIRKDRACLQVCQRVQRQVLGFLHRWQLSEKRLQQLRRDCHHRWCRAKREGSQELVDNPRSALATYYRQRG